MTPEERAQVVAEVEAAQQRLLNKIADALFQMAEESLAATHYAQPSSTYEHKMLSARLFYRLAATLKTEPPK